MSLTKTNNKLPTHLYFTILMSDGFFFLPDLLLQNEFLSVDVKGMKWFDHDDDFITDLKKYINKKKRKYRMWSFWQCVQPEANSSSFKGVTLIAVCLTMREDSNNDKLVHSTCENYEDRC